MKQLSDCIAISNIKNLENMTQSLLSEINIISGLVYEHWSYLLEYIKLFPKPMTQYLTPVYHKNIMDRWGESVFREEMNTYDLALSIETKAGEHHKNIASAMRKKAYYENLDPFTIEDLNMFPKPELRPIVFEEIYVKIGAKKLISKPKIDEREHLFVLVHGFQGSSFDMRLLRDNLNMLHPNAIFLCSNSNEDNTDGDIDEMGKNLAYELKCFIKDRCGNEIPKKISFLGHSLGGVIIRAALPHLSEYENRMHTFLSLSSPHLGYMYNSSKLIDAGIWILKRWKKSVCLQQLSMSDAENVDDTYLFKLAMKPGLNWFQHIGFLSSYQDQYVPFESARIQKCPQASLNSRFFF